MKYVYFQLEQIMKTLIKRYFLLMLGLFTCAIGQNLFIFCDLGLNAWNVFHQGLSLHLPITIGQASQITGFIIIGSCLFIKIYPGIGTILNMIFIGMFTDLILESGLISTPDTFVAKLIMCVAGVCVLGFGIFLYMNQELGAGPRDGLMLALTQRTRFQVGTIRNFIEITVLVIGFFLGGQVGVGTIVSSLGAGISLQFVFKLFKRNAKELKQENLANFFLKLKNNKA